MQRYKDQRKSLQASAIFDQFVSSYTKRRTNFLKCLVRRCREDESRQLPRQTAEPKEVTTAERELASFRAAVAEEYGVVEATRAAQDWIEELEKSGAAHRADWRAVTIAAASRLADRVASPAQK